MSLLDLTPRRGRWRRFLIASLVLALAVSFVAYKWARDAPPDLGRPLSQLITLRPDGSVAIGYADMKKPVLDVYEDYQCPVCAEFEQGESAKAMRDAALRGDLTMLIHPMTIFRDSPMRANSHRALVASLCVTDPVEWLTYHDALYAAQPSELKEGGFAVRDLVALAKKSGVSRADFADCLTSQDVSAKADRLSKAAAAEGVEGTPTVRYNGRDIDWATPGVSYY